MHEHEEAVIPHGLPPLGAEQCPRLSVPPEGCRSLEPDEAHPKKKTQDGNYDVLRLFAKHERKQQKSIIHIIENAQEGKRSRLDALPRAPPGKGGHYREPNIDPR